MALVIHNLPEGAARTGVRSSSLCVLAGLAVAAPITLKANFHPLAACIFAGYARGACFS